MIDLTAISEQALEVSLEGVWGQEIVLTSPSGVSQTVRGQVVREAENVSEDSRGIGQGGRHSLVVTKCSVAIRTSSLDPIPDSIGHWLCRVPVGPVESADTQLMFVESAPQGSKTLGITVLKLTSAKDIE